MNCIIFFSILIVMVKCHHIDLSFSGGGTRAMILTKKVLERINLKPVKSISGISGGTWGILATHNRVEDKRFIQTNRDMCVRTLVSLFPNCKQVMDEENYLPVCHRIPKYARSQKYTTPGYLTFGIKVNGLKCMDELKAKTHKWKELWQKWVYQYTCRPARFKQSNLHALVEGGDWDDNGLLQDKDIYFHVSLYGPQNVDYGGDGTIARIKLNSKSKLGIIEYDDNDKIYKITQTHYTDRIGGHAKKYKFSPQFWSVVSSSAFSVDLGLYMGIPIQIFESIGAPLFMREAKHKLPVSKMTDGGVIVNNPFWIKDQIDLRVQFDWSADKDFGMTQVNNMVRIFEMHGRNVEITTICAATGKCNFGPIHLLTIDNKMLILHIRPMTPRCQNVCMLWWPTTVMNYNYQEIHEFDNVLKNWFKYLSLYMNGVYKAITQFPRINHRKNKIIQLSKQFIKDTNV